MYVLEHMQHALARAEFHCIPFDLAKVPLEVFKCARDQVCVPKRYDPFLEDSLLASHDTPFAERCLLGSALRHV